MKLKSLIYTITKINSKWIKDLNLRVKTKNCCNKTLGKIFIILDLAMISWNNNQKPQTKEKTDKSDISPKKIYRWSISTSKDA